MKALIDTIKVKNSESDIWQKKKLKFTRIFVIIDLSKKLDEVLNPVL